MKNIYEDGRDYPAGEPEDLHSEPTAQERRQHRSAEEKRERRNERRERDAQRRTAKETAQEPAQPSRPPVYGAYEAGRISMAAPYGINKNEGEPVHITQPQATDYVPYPPYPPYPPQGYVAYPPYPPYGVPPTYGQPGYAPDPGAIYPPPYAPAQPAAEPKRDAGAELPYTAGMKIVYQSPDYYYTNNAKGPVPVIRPGEQPTEKVQPPVVRAVSYEQRQASGQWQTSPQTGRQTQIPRIEPRPKVEDVDVSERKTPMPRYSAGQAFEQELKKSGRFAASGSSGFSVSNVDTSHIRPGKTEYDVEEIRLDEKPRPAAKAEKAAGEKKAAKSGAKPKNEKKKEAAKAEKNAIPQTGFIPDDFDDDFDEKKTKRSKKDKKPKKEKAPKAEKTSFDKARITVLVISLVIALGSVAYLGYEFKLKLDNKRFEEEISASAQAELTEPTKKKKKKDKNKNETPAVEETTMSDEENFALLRAQHPEIMYPVGLQARFAPYYTENQDFVGYITINGLGISLPVVQGVDDEEYLKKNFYGQSTKYGCPFVMHTNNMEVMDRNTVIYGHYMRDGSVFAALHDYKEIDGYRAAPVITFNTIYKDYKWKIIAVFITNTYAGDDNNYYFRYYFSNLASEQNFEDYLSAIKERSLYSTGVDVLPTDKLLTLSTCTYEFSDARLVVVARMVRPGESAEVDTSLATLNDEPRYPQAYYDKKGRKNPYAKAERWYPDN